jgi:ferrochelatase
MDKNIIAAPLPVRWLLAQWISITRGRGAARESYRALGYRSPLLQNTQDQAHALEAVLRGHAQVEGDVRCFVTMRYWHPMAAETAKAVRRYNPDQIILLPLYPQFSTTTVRSSLQAWEKAAKAAGLEKKTLSVCCYPRNEGFIGASAKLLAAALDQAPKGTRVLFSAHGLPEKVIRDGDPYQWQCEETAREIVARLDRPGLDWQICYQSRVGPLKWIGPSTEEALEKAASDGVGVLVYPHAFVSEHVETLVEIEMEYREKAHHLGIPWFGRVGTVGTHPDFIAGLAHEVLAVAGRGAGLRICPPEWRRCPCAAASCPLPQKDIAA